MKRLLKRICCTFLTLLFIGSMLPVGASSVTGIHVMAAYQVQDSNRINLSIRASDKANMPVANLGPVSITANGGEAVAEKHPGGAAIGHILVVDTSKYYVTSLDMTEIMALAQGMLAGIPGDERVMLITTDVRGVTAHGWESADKVLSRLSSYGQQVKETQSDIYAAIEQAIDIAFAAQGQGGPDFVSSVLVVTDCMMGDGTARRQPSILAKVKDANRGIAFAAAWPKRESYLKGDWTNSAAVKSGSSEFEIFAENMGGKLIAIPHEGNDRQETLGGTQVITTEVSKQLAGIHYFVVDVTNLIGLVQYKRDDSLTIEVAAGSSRGLAKDVPFNSLHVTPPTPTPEPTATPDPITPVPAPTPVVALESSHKEARQVLLRLQELHYLTTDTNGVFNEEARKAFDLFMMTNGREWTDGVFEDAFNFLMKGNPIPNATPTPLPPTPPPTPAPADLVVGAKDPEGGPTYIYDMQKALNVMQYYKLLGITQYTPGLFDEPTMQAVQLFCDHFSIVNTMPTGASLAVQQAILEAPGKWTPVPPTAPPTFTPAPTAIPVVDLHLGDKDADFGDRRIERLQMRLKELNCYDLLGLSYTPGVVDQATLDAVEFFCSHYKITNGLPNGIRDSMQNNLMDENNKWEKIGPSPTPAPTGMIEGFREKLTGVVSIGDFEIPIWVIALVSAVLLLAIIIVMVLLRASRRSAKFDEPSKSSMGALDVRPAGGLEEGATMPDLGPAGGSDSTMPLGDADMTIAGAAGIPVTILIEYAGSSRTETPIVSDSLTIGRKLCNIVLNDADKGVSRRHAELFSRNGSLYIRDLGSVNGTFVDGVQVASGTPQQGEVTVAIDMFNPSAGDFALTSGAKVRMGHHTLTITW